MSADYKAKYLDIRAKLISSTDTAYRLGYEAGLKEGEQQAAMQQQQQQEAMMQQQMAAQQGMPPEGEMPPEGMEGEVPPEMAGMEGEMPPQEGEMPPEGMEGAEGGSELDGHIAEPESLVAKGEKPSIKDLRKAVDKVVDLRKSQKTIWKNKSKQNSTSQKSLVNDILKKWEEESKDVTDDLEDMIKEHGLKIE